jgi:hypothetical protein
MLPPNTQLLPRTLDFDCPFRKSLGIVIRQGSGVRTSRSAVEIEANIALRALRKADFSEQNVQLF